MPCSSAGSASPWHQQAWHNMLRAWMKACKAVARGLLSDGAFLILGMVRYPSGMVMQRTLPIPTLTLLPHTHTHSL